MTYGTKIATYRADHETAANFSGIVRHDPGLDIEVQWSPGWATETRAAFDRAVVEVRAQIVDAEESR